MTAHCFVYGTLLDPWLLRAVCGTLAKAEPALLHGWRRESLHGCSFPGIRRAPGHLVVGLRVGPFTPQQLRLLDTYEADPYQRLKLAVLTDDGVRPAWTYTLINEQASLCTGQSWQFNRWKTRYRARALRDAPGNRQ